MIVRSLQISNQKVNTSQVNTRSFEEIENDIIKGRKLGQDLSLDPNEVFEFLRSNKHSTCSVFAEAFGESFEKRADIDIDTVFEFIRTRDNYPFDYWVGKNLDLKDLDQKGLKKYLDFIDGKGKDVTASRPHFAKGFAANPSLNTNLILDRIIEDPNSFLAQGFVENPNADLSQVQVKDIINKKPSSKLALASKYPGKRLAIYNGKVQLIA